MVYSIRGYQPEDLPHLYRICLLTGNNGADASDSYRDPDLPGHFWAAPYAVLEPGLCFVLTADWTPCGYIAGTYDTASFCERCERDWFPELRKRYPLPVTEDNSPDANVIRLIHNGHKPNPDLADYPPHLHINLLPMVRGQGFGRKLMEAFTEQLRRKGAQSVHLGVSRQNERALGFYEQFGFTRIKEYEGWLALGLQW